MQWYSSLKLKCNSCNYVHVKQKKVNISDIIINKFESCQLSKRSRCCLTLKKRRGGVLEQEFADDKDKNNE